jgi:MoaA/NifB/PqqE/SkfB family radical SAM enzyme
VAASCAAFSALHLIRVATANCSKPFVKIHASHDNLSALNTLIDAAKLTLQQQSHRVRVLPIIVVYLNNICDSRCVTCSIWKNNDLLQVPADRHMSDALIEELCDRLPEWHPRQIVLSGGEPVLHPRFANTVERFRKIAPQVCLVTNGLLLGGCEREVLVQISEFYISFDAADSESYRAIRGVDGYSRLATTIGTLSSLSPRPRVIARCTLQRKNVHNIPALIENARNLGFAAISFLAADISSMAFSRDLHGIADAEAIQPTVEDLAAMEADIQSIKPTDSFVEGGRERLVRILQYFRAMGGHAPFPEVRCNAPWVSVVIETTGKTRGCFFQPVFGNFRDMNGDAAVQFRTELDVSNDATCRRCVCSKYLSTQDFIRLP